MKRQEQSAPMFKSLEHILGSLKEESGWQDQPFHRLLNYWPEAVGTVVAAHTRPTSIQREVLWVATSSAVWAQELSFGRQRILAKLNAYLPSPLLDIRFSTAQWQRTQNSRSSADEQTTVDAWRSHPSLVLNAPQVLSSEKPHYQNPDEAFKNWAKVMQRRSRNLPLCPQCQCPTPEGELRRWGICSICVAKQW